MNPLRTVTASLTYANVVSTLCLFVVLGGGAYAATSLEPNSVRSKTIKNGQVKVADLADGAVTSSKVVDRSLLAADFAPGQLPAGAKGDAGAKGATGATGAPGLSGLSTVYSVNAPFDSVSPKTASVACPAGTRVVGTGFNLNAPGGNAVEQHLNVVYVLPTADDTAVSVKVTEDAAGTTANWNIVPLATCAKVAP